MGSKSAEQHSGDVQSLVERLSQFGGVVDCLVDDLGKLAKMHGCSEALAELTGPNGASPCAVTHGRATALTETLRHVILGDATDLDGAVASILESVAALSGQGSSGSQGGPVSPADDESGSEEVVAVDAGAAPMSDEVTPTDEQAASAVSNAGPAQGETVLVNAESLIEQLSRAFAGIDKGDLQELAAMHTTCEKLAELTGESGESPCAPTHRRATALGGLTVQVIFGESEDPDAVMASIAETVAALEAKEPPPSSSDGSPAAGKDLSDAEVAAKLDAAFEDKSAASASPDDRAESQPPQPGPSTSASSAERPTESSSEAQAPPESGPVEQSGTESAAEPPYESVPLFINEKELEFVKSFVEEAYEHIEGVEAAVLNVEKDPDDESKINDLFRPFHTIKGMAGFLNLRDINCLTHEVETLLDQARKGKRAITSGVIDLVFDVVDILKIQNSAIGAYMEDPHGGEVPQPPVAAMIGTLRDVIAGRLEPGVRESDTGSAAMKTGENLVAQGAVPQETVDFALEAQKAGADKKTGEILIESKVITPKQVSKAIRAQSQGQKALSRQAGTGITGDHSVRIDTAKLDALVDMVGELVIAQTQVSANALIGSDTKLSKNVSQVNKIVRDVQEVAMAMRMIPIGPTFQKMARLVRDVSRKAGKQVELHISGEDTELDKNVIQLIGDPLVHMVRNAVDHGVEPAEARRAVGKSEVGNVYLDAFHQGGNIVIEIRDDGKGLDPETLIAKGIEKGLVQPGEELTDQQAFALVMAAGFSTAQKVTDISGRGVGMDVVKRNIEQLRGRIEIASQKGQGSTFSIRLPLTLAIIDGMVVRVGSERFIIPTITIEQSLRPRPEQLNTVQHKAEVINVRGRLLPLVQLGQLFGLTGRIDPCDAMVVVAQCDDQHVAVAVEELLGQQQVVIKTLGERFEKLRGISGAAILGDGRVGLILEMSGVLAAHKARAARASISGRSSIGPSTAEADAGPCDPPAADFEASTCDAAIDSPGATPEPVVA